MSKTSAARVYPSSALLPVYRHFAHSAVKLFNTEGSVQPQFFMVTLDQTGAAPMKSMSVVDPRMVQSLMTSSRTKDLVKPMLKMLLNDDSPFRQMLKKRKVDLPDVVVQISEVWMATADQMPSPGYTGSLADAPGRKEAIAVIVHGPAQSMMGLSPIEDQPTRHAEYGEPQPDTLNLTGRMSMNDEMPDDETRH